MLVCNQPIGGWHMTTRNLLDSTMVVIDMVEAMVKHKLKILDLKKEQFVELW